MSTPVAFTLPEPISAYFLADQQSSLAVARCFTAQAIVNDVGQLHTGTDEIKAWKEKASSEYAYTMQPFAWERDGEFHLVRVHTVGSFKGSPLDMVFRFRLERGLIASMEITV